MRAPGVGPGSFFPPFPPVRVDGRGPGLACTAARVVRGSAGSGLWHLTVCPPRTALPSPVLGRGGRGVLATSSEHCNVVSPRPKIIVRSARTDYGCSFICYRGSFHSQRASAPGAGKAPAAGAGVRAVAGGEEREPGGGCGTGRPGRAPPPQSSAPFPEQHPPSPTGFL